MTSPRALLLSIAATLCGFVLALVAVVGQASTARHPRGGVALAPSTVAVVAQEISRRRARSLYGGAGVRQPATPRRVIARA